MTLILYAQRGTSDGHHGKTMSVLNQSVLHSYAISLRPSPFYCDRINKPKNCRSNHLSKFYCAWTNYDRLLFNLNPVLTLFKNATSTMEMHNYIYVCGNYKTRCRFFLKNSASTMKVYTYACANYKIRYRLKQGPSPNPVLTLFENSTSTMGMHKYVCANYKTRCRFLLENSASTMKVHKYVCDYYILWSPHDRLSDYSGCWNPKHYSYHGCSHACMLVSTIYKSRCRLKHDLNHDFN